MTLDDILMLATAGESETSEFKETTGRRREAAQTLCAMLNSQGGRVIFGVTPDGQVAGQQVSDETIEDVVAEIQRIDPPAFPTIDRISIDGSHEAIMVSVIQGHTRPYRYRGDAYRRVGNTTLKMSQDEYNQMLFERMHNEQRWENQPAPGWSVDDLDVTEIILTVEESIRRGRLDDPGTRDPEALREALADAICHREYTIGGGSVGVAIYDDRLEVTSTGPLHFGLTPEKLFAPHESQPWNPLIAGAFYRRGIIEQWGRGTIKMAELTESAGLPRPEIADSGGGVTVTFRPSQYIPPQRAGRDLTERQQAILALLHNSERGLSTRDIHSELKSEIGERQLRRELDTLRTLELVALTGRGRWAKWNIS